MTPNTQRRYFFSIQPFWHAQELQNQVCDPTGQIMASEFHWNRDHIDCVPGNGQVGIMVRGPEDFKGYCFGVMDKRGQVPLYDLTQGEFIRFSPGTFSRICKVSAQRIDPRGVPLSDIFLPSQLEQMQQSMAQEHPTKALVQLFSRWAELATTSRPSREGQLAGQVTRMIWEHRGNIRVRELEENTAYSARYLQDILTRQVGVCPKQMCSQVRFQHALRAMGRHPGANQSQLAQTLGFSDQAHFCREFKRFSGVSPSEFQKRLMP